MVAAKWWVGAACVSVAGTAWGGELVFNGGFETGDFTGWNVPPLVFPPNPNPQIFDVATGPGAHSGQCYAGLSSTELRFISQVLPTTAGQDYELTFWLKRPDNFPDQFQVRWEGQVVYNNYFALPDGVNWHPFTVQLHSQFNGSLLEIGQSFFPGYQLIDDISVVAIPGPSVASLLLLGGAWVARRRRLD